MSRREGAVPHRPADQTCFVEVATSPSRGVEVSTGRAWVGVDQQVGHGSADALFVLTSEQYVDSLTDASVIRVFEGEAWRGEHDDLRLFEPRGAGAWRPEHWVASRPRVIPPPFAGEIWHHVDALGTRVDGERIAVSRALAAGTAHVAAGPTGVAGLSFALIGEDAYPRPAALIAGIRAGASREQVLAVLGDPVDDTDDVHAIEGDHVLAEYADGALVRIVLERPPARSLPAGSIRAFLAALGTAEFGTEFRAIARLSGGTGRRWAASSGAGRRLIAFDGGVEVHVEGGRVLSARIPIPGHGHASPQDASELLAGMTRSPNRDDLHRVLGPPAAARGATELYRYGERDLVVEYDRSALGETASAITVVLVGVGISHRFHRWRSGEFTMFLDLLGSDASSPLAEHVRGLAGTRVRSRGGVVTAVEIGGMRNHAERFAAFVDGMPGEPTRKDLPFGRPAHAGERDDVHDFAQGWIHVHAADGERVTTIAVARDRPRTPAT